MTCFPSGRRTVLVSRSTLFANFLPSYSSWMRTAVGTRRFFSEPSVPKNPTGWSADGQLLIYTSVAENGGDIWALPLAGKPEPFPVLAEAADERYGTLSPDGHWLAYISNETATYQVYVAAFPTPGIRRQVSTVGGFEPLWRRDGKELFYMSPDQTLMSVEVNNNSATAVQSAEGVVFHSLHVDGDSGGCAPLRCCPRRSTLPDQQGDGRSPVCTSDRGAQLDRGSEQVKRFDPSS